MQTEFSMQRMVTFAETDLAGVMHFSNYYRWMEEVEHAFWRSLGLSVVDPREHHAISWPRVRTSCEYYQPARFEDVLSLRLRVLKVGNKSLEFEIEFQRGSDLLARGVTTCVCCEMQQGRFRSVEIPPPVRSKLIATLPQTG